MYHAFETGALDIARLLVSRGASLDHIDVLDCTVLHWLFWARLPEPFGCDELITRVGIEFLDFLAASSFEDFTTLDSCQHPPLHALASRGMSDACHRLLRLGADAKVTANTQIINGSSLVYAAIVGGSVAFLNTVLTVNPGFDINMTDPLGRTSLHQALDVYTSNLSLVDYLFEHGADIDQKDIHGCTALYQALAGKAYQSQRLCEKLMDRSGKLETVDCIGNSILHHATTFGHMTGLKILLEKGLEVNAKNTYNHTPLHHAGVLLGDNPAHFARTDLSFQLSTDLEQKLLRTVDLLLTWGANPHISGCFFL